MNKVFLVGNLGRDAETKFTPSGTACTRFTLATTRRVKRGEEWKDETTWHNIVLWRKEGLANYLTKGKLVSIIGRIDNRSYEGDDGVRRYISEVVAEEIKPLSRNGGGGQKDQHREYDGGDDSTPDADDDVPF